MEIFKIITMLKIINVHMKNKKNNKTNIRDQLCDEFNFFKISKSVIKTYK